MAALTRWEPFVDFGELRSRFDRMFEDLMGDGERRRWWAPAVDMVETDGKLIVRADMPGIKADEISIEIEDDVLTISGEHEEVEEEKGERFVRRERRHGSFRRSLPLPAGVTAEDIEAVCHDGILEVTVPLPAAKEKKTIEIKTKGGGA